MDPITFIVLIAFSRILAIGLLVFAPGFLVLYGPLLAVCWAAGMLLYVGCAYLFAWLDNLLAAQEQAALDRWRASLPETER